MSTQKAARLLVMHMFFVGFQAMSVLWNTATDNAVMVTISATMVSFSGFCAYECYRKLTEPTQDTP